ncbi:MAG: four helix bundle protein [Candidatus Cloacimonetes bacterium]|nr:four helix bundle protein [Candidatus Cloacimonadota bacterium]
MREYGFEKLVVWQNARKLVQKIYCLTKGLPAEEKFGLISQIQRAAVSVSSNIAEGASRKGYKDQAHFYQIAYASLMEVLCQLILCRDLNYIAESGYNDARESIDMIAYQLTKLRNAAINQPPQPSNPLDSLNLNKNK